MSGDRVLITEEGGEGKERSTATFIGSITCPGKERGGKGGSRNKPPRIGKGTAPILFCSIERREKKGDLPALFPCVT